MWFQTEMADKQENGVENSNKSQTKEVGLG